MFTAQGYADTSTQEIVRSAGVTRGALYYHYHDKAELFEAVFVEARAAHIQAIRDRIQAAEGDLWQRVVVTGCRAFVESVATPSVQRIVHTDGPAVLDRTVLQTTAPGLRLLREIFEQLMAEGLIEQMPLDPLSYLFWATFFEAGTYIASAADQAVAQQEMLIVLERLFTGLRPVSQRQAS